MLMFNFSLQDESLSERLIGLTEMFPKEVRNFGYNLSTCMCSCVKGNSQILSFVISFR